MSQTSHDASFLREVVLRDAAATVTVDDDGCVVYANETFEGMVGVSSDRLRGTEGQDLFTAAEHATTGNVIERVRRTDASVTGGVPALVQSDDGSDVPVRLRGSETERDEATYLTVTVTHRADTVGGTARPATAEQITDTTLGALTEVRRRLADADDVEAVVAEAIESLSDVLGFDLGCLRLTDESGSLYVAEATPEVNHLVETEAGFAFALSEAGRAFRTDERIVVREQSETAVDDILTARAHFPLGDHGVFTVATTDGERLTDRQIDLLQFLAGGIEVCLDRIDRQRQLREQREAVAAKQERLETITDIAALTHGVIRALLTTESRDDMESVVCERLASSDVYDGALIADTDPTTDRLELHTSAGIADSTRTAIDGTAVGDIDGLTLDADTTNPVRVHTAGDATQEDEPLVAVPLCDGDRVFGLLAVAVPRSEALDSVVDRCLGVLADTMSFALSSIESEQLLLADEAVQLEFQVTDPSCLAVALSERLDTYVSMKRTVQNAHDEHLSYVRVEGTSPSRAVEAATAVDTVRDCRVINDYGDDCLIEVTRDNSGAEVMMEFGATMRTAEADAGRGTLVLEAPQTVDVRRIAEAYQTYNPESELLSKRRVDRPVQTAEQLRADIEKKLTQKQLSAITSAYFSGYYEWPRESNAEEIAESMGITASTLHQHLRRAHQKILMSLLETSFSRRL